MSMMSHFRNLWSWGMVYWVSSDHSVNGTHKYVELWLQIYCSDYIITIWTSLQAAPRTGKSYLALHCFVAALPKYAHFAKQIAVRLPRNLLIFLPLSCHKHAHVAESCTPVTIKNTGSWICKRSRTIAYRKGERDYTQCAWTIVAACQYGNIVSASG